MALQAFGFVAEKETTWRVKGENMAEPNRGSQTAASRWNFGVSTSRKAFEYPSQLEFDFFFGEYM